MKSPEDVTDSLIADQQIDQYVKLNTPGRNDGVLRAWIDEDRVCEYTSLKFRNDGYGDIKLSNYWFDFYYGGSWTSPSDNRVYFDRLTSRRGRSCRRPSPSPVSFSAAGRAVGRSAERSDGPISPPLAPPRSRNRRCPTDRR